MDELDLACYQNFTSFNEGKETKEGRKIKENFLIFIDYKHHSLLLITEWKMVNFNVFLEGGWQ
jgi:hypothetical protein